MAASTLAVSEGTTVALISLAGTAIVATLGLVGAWYKRAADRAAGKASEAEAHAKDSSSFVGEFREYVDTITRENKEIRERAEVCEQERRQLRDDLAETKQELRATQVALGQVRVEVTELRATVQAIMDGR